MAKRSQIYSNPQLKEIVPSSERKLTDLKALNAAGLLLGITLILVSLCAAVILRGTKPSDFEFVSDIQVGRILKDDCGYICGQNNTDMISDCGDPDKLELPKLLILKNDTNDIYSTKCVNKCPIGYDDFLNTCVEGQESDLAKTLRILKASWLHILIMSIVAVLVTLIFLILFHFTPKCAIFITNIGFIFMCLASFVFYAVPGFYLYSSPFLVMGLGLFIYLVIVRDKIGFVAGFFEEASNVLIEVKLLSFVPLLTLISLATVSAIYLTFLNIISKIDEDNPLSQWSYWLNTLSYLFIIQFIIGCQNFVIAGVVCRRFFAADKSSLKSPFKESFWDLLRFHLGSVCVGAFLMTIMKIFRRVFKAAQTGLELLNIENIFSYLLDKIFVYLCSNSYVIVAKEGTPFKESGKRAHKLLLDNIRDAVMLNTLGDVSLFSCKMLTTYVVGIVGYLMIIEKSAEFGDFFFLPLTIGCILGFLIARCMILVFEMTVDAVFICSCIDIEDNVAKNRPHFMSKVLEKLIKIINGGTLVMLRRTKSEDEEKLDVQQAIV